MTSPWLDLKDKNSSPSKSGQLQEIRHMLNRRYRPGVSWDDVMQNLQQSFHTMNNAGAIYWFNKLKLDCVYPGSIKGVQDGGSRSRYLAEMLRDEVEARRCTLVIQQGQRGKPLPLDLDAADFRIEALGLPLNEWHPYALLTDPILAGTVVVTSDDRDVLSRTAIRQFMDLAALAEMLWNANHGSSGLTLQYTMPTDATASLSSSDSGWRLGEMKTREPEFYETVLRRLKNAIRLGRVTILMTGPTGSGKSSIAKAFHNAGHRTSQPFVTFDCSQVTSAETMGAELFGYAKESGFHNSPHSGREGKANLADGGILFLDEISCLPFELQHRLLRLIETGKFSPLGESRELEVDVSIIAATNVDLNELVRLKKFREDLFWRLNVLRVQLPDLNNRRADIETLANTHLRRSLDEYKISRMMTFSTDSLRVLSEFNWAECGNIRGLSNSIIRTVVNMPEHISEIEPRHLILESVDQSKGSATPSVASIPDRSAKGSFALETIRAAVVKHGFGSRAAAELGITYRQLTWCLQANGLTIRAVLTQCGSGLR